ncbi:MAG: PadR family transcriptional regulator [Comamonadaceae bacterium CG_4_9_14_3_um_filter_60_33]|nr:MAG: PadR family transcriptional regulator [Comamonadaceae bacterium CG_4_10_14_3_um_filter_60_42]PJB46468.1 MAG: PadR family transcriptional regulator [Comamonadaceae bacterium CG_4_9_14_3_um_filter_60_33]
MALSHALLTSLLEKSSSGYDLARRFDKSIGFFWHATHQQIYRELARMELAGWIASSSAPDAGKTRKRIYRALPTGQAELRRWATEPSPTMDLRDEFMVRLRADAALGSLGLAPELARRMALHEEKLALYRDIEQRDFAEPGKLPRAARIHHMILKKGILYEENSIAWAREMIEMLSEADTGQRKQPVGGAVQLHIGGQLQT